MFKSISKPNLGIVAKNATLALALVCGFCLSAKAEDTKSHQTLQVSCNPFASKSFNTQCEYSSIIESESEQIAQRRGRSRKSKVDGYYAGFTLGAGFGSGEVDIGLDDFDNPEYGNSFLISLFEGIKFNKNVSADLEFLLGFGGVDTDPLNDEFDEILTGFDGSVEIKSDYSTFALYINPRFELPLADRGKFNLYISPGIGLSQTNVSLSVTSNIENFLDEDGVDQNVDETEDASATGVTFQVKAGASLAITSSIQAVAQARYLTLPTDDSSDSISIFGADAGLKFNF